MGFLRSCFYIFTISVFLVSCGGGGSSGSNQIPQPPTNSNPSPQVTVTGPTSVERSSLFTISWSSSNATSCNASGHWSGGKSLSGSEQYVIDIVGNYEFTLECSNASGASASNSLEVAVIKPPLTYPIPLTLMQSNIKSDSILVSTEEKNAQTAKDEDIDEIRLANTGLPVAYTLDEYQKSFIYEGGGLHEISPVFEYKTDVEIEEEVKIGNTFLNSNSIDLYVQKTSDGDDYYLDDDDDLVIVTLTNDDNSLIFNTSGYPVFVFATNSNCQIKYDSDEKHILVELKNEQGELITDASGNSLMFSTTGDDCSVIQDDNGNLVYEMQIKTIQVIRETECDLSGLGVEILRNWSLDENDPTKLLLWLISPKEIINSDCQVGYSTEFVIVSNEFSGVVTSGIETIDSTNSFYSLPAWIVPANLKGRNNSQHAIIYSDQYSYTGNQAWEINISDGRVDFIQIIPSTKTVQREMIDSAYNGTYYVTYGGTFGREAAMTVYEKGMAGFEYVEIDQSQCIKANDLGFLPGFRKSDDRSIIFVSDDEVAIRGDFCPSPLYTWMKYSLSSKEWSTFGYDNTESSWEDVVGCVADSPLDTDASGWPKEFFDDAGLFHCKNIKYPLASFWGAPLAFYNDWLISGYGPYYYGAYATNLITGYSTGTLNCPGFTNETGRRETNYGYDECGGSHSYWFKNFIHTVTDMGYVFLRYDLDNNSYVRFDLRNDTDYELTAIGDDPYILFKDRVFLQYIDSSNANLYLLELDFETGEIHDRGLIENAEYRVISFITPLP